MVHRFTSSSDRTLSSPTCNIQVCEGGQDSLSTTQTQYCSGFTPAGFQEISHRERISHWIWETCSPRRSETLLFKDLQLSVNRSAVLGGTERSGVPGTATEIEVN